MKKIILVILPLLLGCASTFAQSNCDFRQKGAGKAGTQASCTLWVSGVPRSFLIHIPASYSPSAGFVLGFHGSHLKNVSLAYTGLTQISDKHGFVLVLPQNGVCETGWGKACANDENYFLQLVALVQQQLHPDPKRLFVTGFSAGAVYAYEMGRRHADKVAATAILEGSEANANVQPPWFGPITTPLSVLILHGTADPVFPYCGSVRGWYSVDQNFLRWAQGLHCAAVDSRSMCTSTLGVPTNVTERHASQCQGGTTVDVYRLEKGVHWIYSNTVPLDIAPGTIARPYNPAAGRAIPVDEMDVVWNWFNQHPKP